MVSQRELAGWTQNATHFCPFLQCLKPRWQNYGRGTRAVESPAQAEDLVEVDKAYVLQPHIRLPLLYTDGMCARARLRARRAAMCTRAMLMRAAGGGAGRKFHIRLYLLVIQSEPDRRQKKLVPNRFYAFRGGQVTRAAPLANY